MADTTPAGMAVCFESYSSYRSRKVWNIHDVMITAFHRSQHLGKHLLQGVVDAALVKITLEVNQHNTAAIALYQSMGFQDYRTRNLNELHFACYTDTQT